MSARKASSPSATSPVHTTGPAPPLTPQSTIPAAAALNALALRRWMAFISWVQAKLIEPVVSSSDMSRAALVLRPAEYGEVLEERVASGKCAYPLCSRPLSSTSSTLPPGKRFHLSLKQQRVYDVEEARQFCSSECFMASQAYQHNLTDEPYYLRNQRMARAQHPAQMQSDSTAPLQSAIEALKLQPSPWPANTPVAEPTQPTSTDSSDPLRMTVVESSSVSHAHPPQLPLAATLAANANLATIDENAPQSAAQAAAMIVEGYIPGSLQHVRPASSKPPNTSAVPHSSNNATSATTTDQTAPAKSDSKPAPSAAALPSSSPEWLPITPLPSVPPAPLPKPDSSQSVLSQQQFDALSPDAQLDYLGHLALSERAAAQRGATQSTGAGSAAAIRPIMQAFDPVMAAFLRNHSSSTAATLNTPQHSSAPSSAEKPIRRRKAASASTSNTNTASASPSAESASPSQPSPANVSKAATSTTTHTPPTRTSRPSTRPSAVQCDDDSDPVITMAEIRQHATAVRQIQLSHSVLLLQCILAWVTPATHRFISNRCTAASASIEAIECSLGKDPSMDIREQRAARQRAFVAMVDPHFSSLCALFRVDRSLAHAMRELCSTFCYRSPIPSLKPDTWRAVALLILRATAVREMACQRQPAATQMSWECMSCFNQPHVNASELERMIDRACALVQLSREQFESAWNTFCLSL